MKKTLLISSIVVISSLASGVANSSTVSFSENISVGEFVTAGNSYSGTVDINDLSGLDLTSGQYTVFDAYITYSVEQTDYLASQTESYNPAGTYSYLASFESESGNHEGSEYNWVATYNNGQRFSSTKENAQGQITVAGGRSSNVQFFDAQNYAVVSTDEQILPGTVDVLERTITSTSHEVRSNRASNNGIDLDPLTSIIDGDGVLDYEFTVTSGEMTLAGLGLFFSYSENPNWVAPAVTAVPLPATLPLFASALAAFGLFRRRQQSKQSRFVG